MDFASLGTFEIPHRKQNHLLNGYLKLKERSAQIRWLNENNSPQFVRFDGPILNPELVHKINEYNLAIVIDRWSLRHLP